MSTGPITHFVFVDFENVPGVDLAATGDHPVQVTLLLGKHQKKLDVSLVKEIQRLGDRFALVEVGAAGHNALDLTLAYYLGRSVESSPEAQFAIVSKDKDFEPLIAHLHTKGVRVTRHDSFATLPFLPQTKPAKTRPAKTPRPARSIATPAPPMEAVNDDRLARLISRLQNNLAPRPKKRAGLLARIKTDFGNKLTDPEADAKLEELISRGVLTIDDADRVTYR